MTLQISIRDQLVNVASRLFVLEQSVTRLVKAIEGNGKPGLNDLVIEHDNKIDTIQAEIIRAIDERKQVTDGMAVQIKINTEKLDTVALIGCRYGQQQGHGVTAKNESEDKNIFEWLLKNQYLPFAMIVVAFVLNHFWK